MNNNSSYTSKKLLPQISLSFPVLPDPNIRVACLTCLGAIVSIAQPLVEVWTVLQPGRHQRISSSSSSAQGFLDEKEQSESGYQSSQSEGLRNDRLNTPGTSGSVTPISGTRTPTNPEVCQHEQIINTCIQYALSLVNNNFCHKIMFLTLDIFN